MLIFDDIGLVYLANPKTGTTSFEHAFSKYANREQSQLLPKHMPFRRFRKKCPEIARQYEFITCVRDPLETLFSWYRYRTRPTLRGQPNSTFGLTFEQFFEEWCKDKPPSCADVSTSVEFILNRKGSISRHLKIFKYGIRPGVQEYAAERLGVKVPELKRNVSRPDPDGQSVPLASRVDTGHKKLEDAYEIYGNIDFANSP